MLQLLAWRFTVSELCELLVHGRICSHARTMAGFVRQLGACALAGPEWLVAAGMRKSADCYTAVLLAV